MELLDHRSHITFSINPASFFSALFENYRKALRDRKGRNHG